MTDQRHPVRVLQCGVGRWGKNHLRTWQRLGVELYVAEPFEKLWDDIRKSGVANDHLVADFAQVLSKVDVVDIVTPVDSHAAIAEQALEAGKDVFVEKPLTATAAQGRDLVRRAQQLGRLIQVGHIFRYDPASDVIRDLVGRGDIGKVRLIQARFSGFKRPRADCGITAADSLHFIDWFNYLLQAQPYSVLARHVHLLGRGMEDASWVLFEYPGASAVVEATYFGPAKERQVTVIGDAGLLTCDFNAKTHRVTLYRHRHVQQNGAWQAVEGEVLYLPVPEAEPLFRELAAFLDSWRTRRPPLADGQAGCDVVDIIEAALQSSESGQVVPFPAGKTHAHDPAVQSLSLRRDQAESPASHRLGTVHPRP